MTLQQALSVLSNPQQSSVAAAGAAGAFSAEVNNLAQAAQQDVSSFQANVPSFLAPFTTSALSSIQTVLKSASGNAAQPGAGTIFGLTYLQAAGVAVVLVLLGAVALGRSLR